MRRTLALLLCTLTFGSASVLARADDPAKTAPVDLQNVKCPVSGMPVRAGVTGTYRGMTVHFCSAEHAKAFADNPAKYEAALRADKDVASKMDAMPGGQDEPAAGAPVTKASQQFHDAMRKLWEDHITWTRTFVIAALADLPDKDAATQRLLRNQDDIGNAIKPYYGDAAGSQLTALLKDHITTAAALVGALKSNDDGKAAAEKAKWFKNADDIAAFLSKANPTAWPLDAATKMMHEHLDATTEEVSARLKKDWAGDVTAYDKVHEQILGMADMLCQGIQNQFPEKFR